MRPPFDLCANARAVYDAIAAPDVCCMFDYFVINVVVDVCRVNVVVGVCRVNVVKFVAVNGRALVESCPFFDLFRLSSSMFLVLDLVMARPLCSVQLHLELIV